MRWPPAANCGTDTQTMPLRTGRAANRGWFLKLCAQMMRWLPPAASAGSRRQPNMTILARISLGGSKSLAIVGFENYRILVASGGDSIASVQLIPPSGDRPAQPLPLPPPSITPYGDAA